MPAAPYMRRVRKTQRIAEPRDKFKTRQEKLEYLSSINGPVRAGCDQEFDDPRY